MKIIVRGAIALAIGSLSALGCAAPTDGSAEEAAVEQDVEDTIGTTSQALNHCATGDTPNETFTLDDAGDTGRYIRTAGNINPSGCGGNARRVTIVRFNVSPDARPVPKYRWYVKSIGPSVVANCSKYKLYTRLQFQDPSTGVWDDILDIPGIPNDDAQTMTTTGTIKLNSSFQPYCSMPEFRFEREHMRAGAYRIRTYSEDQAEDEYLGVDVRGYNESHN